MKRSIKTHALSVILVPVVLLTALVLPATAEKAAFSISDG